MMTAAQTTDAALRPSYTQRASASRMKEIIRQVLEEELAGQTYQVRELCEMRPEHSLQGDLVQQQTKKVADEVKDRLKMLQLPAIQVHGSSGHWRAARRGRSVSFFCHRVFGTTRCHAGWGLSNILGADGPDTYASETLINDSIFCCVVAYAVYLS